MVFETSIINENEFQDELVRLIVRARRGQVSYFAMAQYFWGSAWAMLYRGIRLAVLIRKEVNSPKS